MNYDEIFFDDDWFEYLDKIVDLDEGFDEEIIEDISINVKIEQIKIKEGKIVSFSFKIILFSPHEINVSKEEFIYNTSKIILELEEFRRIHNM